MCICSLSGGRVWNLSLERERYLAERQPSATSNAVTLRRSRLNSTPIRLDGPVENGHGNQGIDGRF